MSSQCVVWLTVFVKPIAWLIILGGGPTLFNAQQKNLFFSSVVLTELDGVTFHFISSEKEDKGMKCQWSILRSSLGKSIFEWLFVVLWLLLLIDLLSVVEASHQNALLAAPGQAIFCAGQNGVTLHSNIQGIPNGSHQGHGPKSMVCWALHLGLTALD